MKKYFLLPFAFICITSNAQIRGKMSLSVGAVDCSGFSSKFTYGYTFNDMIGISLNTGYFNKSSGDFYMTTLYDRNVYSYSVNSGIESGFYSNSNLYNIGISTDLNILKFFKLKNHKLTIGAGLYFKKYEISNININIDNINNLFVRSITHKKQTTFGLNYSAQYDFLLSNNFSIGCGFDVIPYDGGNSNTISVVLTRYF